MPRRTPLTLLILALGMLAGCAPLRAPAAWAPGEPPLTTEWTGQVTADNVLPEYPRPQLVRPDWQSLNGVWEFAPANEGEPPPFGQGLAERVLVPFPIESALSGVQRHHDRMWYRRGFTLPEAWAGRRIQLNFGAVDWEAAVYVNGQQVGSHRGGYDAFSFDITPQLRAGANELIVGVYDPTDRGEQPVGKQRSEPEGIFYTASSGIWQTAWLEPTAAAHITRLDITPDLPGEALRLVVHADGGAGHTVQATALDGDVEVGRAAGATGAELRIPLPAPRLWSPERPFLYDLRVSLHDGAAVVDGVGSYFGMRSIAVGKVGPALRLLLNGEFVFQMGTLDQGYWPDGLYTAPTDAALRFEIEQHKALGFNLIRKHVKVEPQRWYYWADKLGLLVWQDMPSMNLANPSPEARRQFEVELRELIDEHRSATSIVMWVPFNEGWSAYDPRGIAAQVKEWDPSRLVNNNSGVNCCDMVDGGNGDVVDWHVYVGPEAPLPSALRASVLGEYGGLGLQVEGHEWRPGAYFSYQDESDAAALTQRYVELSGKVRGLMAGLGLNAAVYTQITDVETELNGLFTYDRAVLKLDGRAIKAANQQLIDESRRLSP
jgi:beta-galactosidase/beta-glucuronidase